jgi:hypothetical protein
MTPRAKYPKAVADVFAAATRQGFQLEQTRRHWKVRDSAGAFVTTVSVSPSDQFARQKIIADLKRAGFVWNGR